MRRAAIDVGSNSVLTTVGEFDGSEWKWIHDSSKVTALGENLKRTGELSEAAIERTVRAIGEGASIANSLEASEILAAATMAARIASNTHILVSRCRDIGIDLQVLSGEREAELGFLSVSEDPAFASAEHLAIVDPGGQSTELVRASKVADRHEVAFRQSFPIGTLGLLEGSLAAECPTSEDLFRATLEIDGLLPNDLPVQVGEKVVTLGATGTNLVSIRERHRIWNPSSVHGAVLEYEEISKAVGWLARMTVNERSKLIGMEPGRERTLHAGALILERFLNSIHAESCMVSVRGWRHALIVHGF